MGSLFLPLCFAILAAAQPPDGGLDFGLGNDLANLGLGLNPANLYSSTEEEPPREIAEETTTSIETTAAPEQQEVNVTASELLSTYQKEYFRLAPAFWDRALFGFAAANINDTAADAADTEDFVVDAQESPTDKNSIFGGGLTGFELSDTDIGFARNVLEFDTPKSLQEITTALKEVSLAYDGGPDNTHRYHELYMIEPMGLDLTAEENFIKIQDGLSTCMESEEMVPGVKVLAVAHEPVKLIFEGGSGEEDEKAKDPHWSARLIPSCSCGLSPKSIMLDTKDEADSDAHFKIIVVVLDCRLETRESVAAVVGDEATQGVLNHVKDSATRRRLLVDQHMHHQTAVLGNPEGGDVRDFNAFLDSIPDPAREYDSPVGGLEALFQSQAAPAKPSSTGATLEAAAQYGAQILQGGGGYFAGVPGPNLEDVELEKERLRAQTAKVMLDQIREKRESDSMRHAQETERHVQLAAAQVALENARIDASRKARELELAQQQNKEQHRVFSSLATPRDSITQHIVASIPLYDEMPLQGDEFVTQTGINGAAGALPAMLDPSVGLLGQHVNAGDQPLFPMEAAAKKKKKWWRICGDGKKKVAPQLNLPSAEKTEQRRTIQELEGEVFKTCNQAELSLYAQIFAKSFDTTKPSLG